MILFPNATNEVRETLARRQVDNAEKWIRKLIHHEFTKAYGSEYMQQDNLICRKIRESIANQKTLHPSKYTRDIDATTFDEAISILTNSRFYNARFRQALIAAYPLGNEEARHFLTRLKAIRNDVSHGQGCSGRQLEQATCYANDLIDSLKAFFKEHNMEKDFNVPTITRYQDSLGNRSFLENVHENVNNRVIDWRRQGIGDLRPGDTLVAEIEIDPSFAPNDYDVIWYVFAADNGNSPTARVLITKKHVGEQFELRFTIKTKKEWHRFHDCDEGLTVLYRVLPPIE
ncbi:MAG TPA: hypothetical protein VIH87_13560 [Methylocella sp.]